MTQAMIEATRRAQAQQQSDASFPHTTAFDQAKGSR
jgi:hypothetical protein